MEQSRRKKGNIIYLSKAQISVPDNKVNHTTTSKVKTEVEEEQERSASYRRKSRALQLDQPVSSLPGKVSTDRRCIWEELILSEHKSSGAQELKKAKENLEDAAG